MIRWREMLMDYGQMYADDGAGAVKLGSTKSGSSFFTVDGDLAAKQKADQELRQTLEVFFRPLFQRFVYGGEKIACHDLKRVLQDEQYSSRLPIDKVHELADVADFNMGRSIKYEEFVRIVTGKSTEDAISDLDVLSAGNGGQPQTKIASFLSFVCRNTTLQDQVDEVASRTPCWFHFPVFMFLITAAQIVLFIVYANGDNVNTEPLEGVPLNNSLMYMPTRRREVWRFFSYCLLHQGYIDLLFNIIIELVICLPLEITFSTWRVAPVYIVGVLVGSLAQSTVDHDVGLVGAAGGAYAILGGHVLGLWKNRKQLNLAAAEGRGGHALCNVVLRFIFIALLVIPQVFLACYRRWIMDDVTVKVGIFAHIGGFAAGLVMCEAFLKDPRTLPWKSSCLLDVFLLMIVIGTAIIVNITYDGYPSEDRTSLSDFVNTP